MSDLIQRIHDAYIANPASALAMLPKLFQAADEGKIVELPCKVGDTVYCESFIRGLIKEFEISDEVWIFAKRKEFGKTVFLTHESAEKALGEREKDG